MPVALATERVAREPKQPSTPCRKPSTSWGPSCQPSWPSCSRSLGKSSRHRSRRRSEEHTFELQSQSNLVCRLLLEKKKILTKHVLTSCTVTMMILIQCE